ncbi:MAG TPA: single-stranded DNA-binding protein [Acidisarcina sp.]
MALYENNVQLKGFLGKDATTKATRQEKEFTILSLATQSSFKDKQTGEWVSHTDWHRVVVFGKQSGFAAELKKGDYVTVEGELRSSQLGIDGPVGESKKRIVWEVRADKIEKLERPTHPEERSEAGPA